MPPSAPLQPGAGSHEVQIHEDPQHSRRGLSERFSLRALEGRASRPWYDSPMRIRLPVAVALLLALSAAASAGDGQVVLRLRDGRLLPGKVVSFDDEGVRHATDAGTAFHPWSALTPYSRYEVRASLLAEDDGDARLALGRWSLEEGLPGEARGEILRARGLGAGKAEEMDQLLARCDRDQAGLAFAEADRRVAAGDLDGAISVLRSYVKAAPLSEWTDRGREKAEDLVRRREADAERRRLEEERRRKDAAATKREAAIAGFLAGGDSARTRAGVLALTGLREEDRGSFTVFRQSFEKAEAQYLDARRQYDRARRLAATDRPEEARRALSGRSAVDGRLLDLYVRLARKFVEAKAWREAQAALDKALRLDPVNAEALDLQDKVNAGWIRRKASDLTGASGHSSDGSSGR